MRKYYLILAVLALLLSLGSVHAFSTNTFNSGFTSRNITFNPLYQDYNPATISTPFFNFTSNSPSGTDGDIYIGSCSFGCDYSYIYGGSSGGAHHDAFGWANMGSLPDCTKANYTTSDIRFKIGDYICVNSSSTRIALMQISQNLSHEIAFKWNYNDQPNIVGLEYLNVSQHTFLINSYFNLTGINTNNFTGLCYQETANASSPGDGNCGLYYNGTYDNQYTDSSFSFVAGLLLFDGNWSTGATSDLASDTYVNVNYTIPKGTVNAIWRVKDLLKGDRNVTLDANCTNTSVSPYLQVSIYRRYFTSVTIQWKAFCNNTWVVYTDDGGSAIVNNSNAEPFEEAMIWNISNPGVYPNNVSIVTDSNNLANYTGVFNQSNIQTPNLINQLNAYLSTCTFVNGFCSIPFIFNAINPSILQYSALIFNDQGIVANSISYNQTAYETSHQTFSFNFSVSSIVSASAILTYNGTQYPSTTNCSGNICIASNAFDLPLLNNISNPENRSFYWNVTTFDGVSSTNSNSQISYQVVNPLILTYCQNGSVTLNFTAYDEQNRTQLKPFDFEGTFDYYAGLGSDFREINISNSSSSEVHLCLGQNTTIYTNAIIAYNVPGLTYPTRNYFYQNYPLMNVTNSVPLYLLSEAASTQFILEVEDNNIQPVQGVLVNAQRCYPGINQNQTVFISRTDSNGLTTGNFEASTALYQFFITNQSNVLLAVTPCAAVVPQSTPFTLLFQIGAGYQSPFININNASAITASLSFNYTTNIATFVYTDTSGNFNSSQLIVRNLNASGNSQPIVCNNQNNLTSGIITCNISQGGSYFANAFVYRSNQILMDQITFNVQTFSSTVGYYGAFLGFFLILVCGFAFKFNEIAGIWLVTVACAVCNYFGLIAFGNVFITAIIILAVILTAVLER